MKQEIDMSKYTIGIDPYDKQETLEEAAENHLQKWRLLNNIHLSNILHAERCKNDFIAGAKWQQDQDVKKIKPNPLLMDEAGHWDFRRQERSYSEEDMREAFNNGAWRWRMRSKVDIFKEWFEQFKKK